MKRRPWTCSSVDVDENQSLISNDRIIHCGTNLLRGKLRAGVKVAVF